MQCVVKGRGCFNLTCFLKVWWGHVNVLVISHSRCSFCKELFIVHSFLAALGLRCCAWAFCRCGEQGPLAGCDAWVSHLGGFPAVVCRLQEVWREFSSCGTRPNCYAARGILLDQGRNPVSCISRRILYHWAAWEGLGLELLEEVILWWCFQFSHGHWFMFDFSAWISFNHSLIRIRNYLSLLLFCKIYWPDTLGHVPGLDM